MPDKTMTQARICSVEECEGRHYAKGYCQFHWARARAGRVLSLPKAQARAGCSIVGCGRAHWGRGWCRLHLGRFQRTGDPLVVRPLALLEVKRGPEHLGWKGDEVGYYAMHRRLYRAKGRASDHQCVDCGQAAAHWSYDHSDLNEKRGEHGPYSTDPDHYLPRCVGCHNRLDQRQRHSGDDGEVCPECMEAMLRGGIV